MRIALKDRLETIPPRWRFAAFLGTAILISFGLTALSYALYVINGTAQLDLSRPGYKKALSEVSKDSGETYVFGSSGPLDAAALKDFKQKFDALSAKTRDYGVFDPSVLGDEQLNLNTDTSSSIGPQ